MSGQTRIISVRHGAPILDIRHKMAEVFGGHDVLRYQLLEVDLDTIVSVSPPVDLGNMMEEYDKIAEAAPDSSAKLRVFLFSPSDLAADLASLLDLEDCNQRYFEAVNWISSDGSLWRKNNLASASSAHNFGGGYNEGLKMELNGTDKGVWLMQKGIRNSLGMIAEMSGNCDKSRDFLGENINRLSYPMIYSVGGNDEDTKSKLAEKLNSNFLIADEMRLDTCR